MTYLLKAVILTCFVGLSMEYCHNYIQEANRCTAPNGAVFQVGEELTIKEKCEKCTCTAKHTSGGVHMGCCGYGINAGVMAAPLGCKFITDTDGCTPKLVQVHNVLLDC